MRKKSYSNLIDSVSNYVNELLKIESDEDLNFALNLAKKRGTPPLQVVPTDGRTLEVLARSIQAKKIVEIGTLCGYSAICLARGLKPSGKLYTCEQSSHHAEIAKEVFTKLNLLEKVELVFGNALETLPALSAKGPFDLIFIDADKLNYEYYFDWSIENLRSGGLLIADNVFVFGYIGEQNLNNDGLSEIVSAMRKFNEKCAQDKRLATTFLPTGEGLMVAVKT